MSNNIHIILGRCSGSICWLYVGRTDTEPLHGIQHRGSIRVSNNIHIILCRRSGRGCWLYVGRTNTEPLHGIQHHGSIIVSKTCNITMHYFQFIYLFKNLLVTRGRCKPKFEGDSLSFLHSLLHATDLISKKWCLSLLHLPSFEAVYCFIYGRRRVAVARYRMICLVHS